MLKPVKLRQVRDWLTHADECDLAFRWQHCRDWRALAVLVLSFKPLVYGIAGERFRAAQLDKGVKVVELEKARKNPELAGHFLELVQAGQLGLLEAVSRYDGSWRFATYARHWIFKRMQEYVRSNWHVVRMPEPAEWKVAKEEQIPATVPNPQLSPFENPLSPDKRAYNHAAKISSSRAAPLASPIEREDNAEENVVGRFGLGTTDYEQSIFGADHFETGEYQSRAHETIEALYRAIELENMSRTFDLRVSKLPPRPRLIVGLRFPLTDANKWTRVAIGHVLGISDECVRQIEEQAKADLIASNSALICSQAEFWGAQPYWNKFRLRRVETNARAWSAPKPQPKDPEALIDELVRLIGLVLKPLKQWLPPRIDYDEEIAKPIRIKSKVVGQINRRRKAASAVNYFRQIGWDLARLRQGEVQFQYLLESGYRGNCPRR
jgi:RNA polymerase sigma factor (sigma-70 family)